MVFAPVEAATPEAAATPATPEEDEPLAAATAAKATMRRFEYCILKVGCFKKVLPE